MEPQRQQRCSEEAHQLRFLQPGCPGSSKVKALFPTVDLGSRRASWRTAAQQEDPFQAGQ